MSLGETVINLKVYIVHKCMRCCYQTLFACIVSNVTTACSSKLCQPLIQPFSSPSKRTVAQSAVSSIVLASIAEVRHESGTYTQHLKRTSSLAGAKSERGAILSILQSSEVTHTRPAHYQVIRHSQPVTAQYAVRNRRHFDKIE